MSGQHAHEAVKRWKEAQLLAAMVRKVARADKQVGSNGSGWWSWWVDGVSEVSGSGWCHDGVLGWMVVMME